MVAAETVRPVPMLAAADRLAAVRRAGLLDTPAEAAFDRLARVARTASAASVALISFLTETRQFVKSSVGLAEPWASRREIPLAFSFCQHVVGQGRPLFIEDTRLASLGTDPQPFNVGAYAGWPLTGENGQVIGCLCVIDHAARPWGEQQRETLQDLALAIETLIELRSASERAVEAARESSERLQMIAHATRDVVYDLTLGTGEIWWSRSLLTLAGYGPDAAAHNLSWWRANIHPDEQSQISESFRAALEGAEPFWSKEYRFRRADGAYVHLFDRGYFIRDALGQPAHFVGAVADISGHRETELAWHESETRFRQLAETAAEGVWLLDTADRTTFVNQQMAEMLGRSREDMAGAAIFDFMEPGDRAAATIELDRRKRGVRDQAELRFRRRDGAEVWTLLSAGPIRGKDGQPAGSFALVTDITERRRAEAQLALQVSNLNTLYEASQDIAAELDPARVYALAHAVVKRLMEAEVFFIALLDQGRREVEEVYMYDRGPAPLGRYPLEHANLTTHVLRTGQPLRIDDDQSGASAALGAELFGSPDDTLSLMMAPLRMGGNVIGVISVQSYLPNAYTDTDEQLFRTLANQVTVAIANARLVQSLRDSEGRFRQLAETIQQFFWITNADGSEMLYASPNYATIWGRPAASLYTSPESLLATVHPDDRALVKAWQAAPDRQADGLQYRIVRPDGSLRWIWSQAFPVRDAAGTVYRMAGISEDITDRRLIEEALARESDLLQALLDSTPDTIYYKDRDSRFTRINEAQRKVLGLETAEAAIGRRDSDFFDSALAQTLLDEEQDLFNTARPLLDKVEYNPTRDGRPRWFSVTKVPLYDRQGQMIGMVGVSRDITGRKLAEIELQAQKDLFENLVAVARATMSLPSLESTLQNTLDVSVGLTAAVRGSLFLLDTQGAVTHSLLSGGQSMIAGQRPIVDQVMRGGLAGWVVRNRQSVLVTDTTTDARWVGAPDQEYHTRSALAVPINYRDVVLGILTLQHTAAGHFLPAHLHLMQAAADQMALALRNARMFDETQTLAEQMYMLNHITQAALEAGTLDDLYQALADRVGALFGADTCHITVWDERQGTALAKASSDPHWRGHHKDFQSLAGEATLTGSVLAEGRALALDDTRSSPYVSRRIAELFSARSSLGLPLIARGRKLGAILLDFEQARHFTDAEIALGERTARQVALALSNALLYREAAEERSRLQALINTSRDGVVLISAENRILICNAPTLKLLGLPDQPAEWLGKPLRAAIKALQHTAPEAARATVSEMRRMLTSGDQPGEGQFSVGAQYVHWLSLPVVSNTAVIGRLLVLRDVTGEHELEALRNDLAHMMVHDLRSPLSAIVSAADLLTGRLADMTETDRELAAVIREGAEHMSSLVGEILDVSQLESGQLPLERKPMAMVPAVAEVLHLQSGALLRKNIRVIEGPAPASALAWADPQLVSRVLQNLIGNAVKFTPSGGQIGVAVDVEGRQLKVSVSNTGAGVPPEVKERLFNKFARGNQKERGSGLGLAFCRLAVEAHNGRIWVESEPGQGATFRFTLPLHEPGN